MNAVKNDYVVLVGGGIGRRWLAHDSLEDDGEPSTQPPTTTDPEMAYRSTSHSEVQKVLKATVRRYPTNEFRVDVLDTQFEARVEALPRLQQQAGAAYTLHQVASKALQDASGDANAVDWAQVHQDVFAKAVGQDKQPVATVLEAIKLHSPGAITPEQIAAIDDPFVATMVQLADSLGKWATVKNDSVDAKLREFNEAFDGEDLRLTAVDIARKVFLQNPEHSGSNKISLPPAFLENMSRILAPGQTKSRDEGPAP